MSPEDNNQMPETPQTDSPVGSEQEHDVEIKDLEVGDEAEKIKGGGGTAGWDRVKNIP